MNEPKDIKCPNCQSPAADYGNEIICGMPDCTFYPRIVLSKKSSLDEKVKALLASGPKTIDVLKDILKEDRGVISNVVYGLKKSHFVSSEWDTKTESFVWKLIGNPPVETLSGEQKEELVLNAVQAGNHLPRAIAKHAGIKETFALIILTCLEGDGKLERTNQLTFSAWYLPGKVPKGKLILDGAGGVLEVGKTQEVTEEVTQKTWDNAQKIVDERNRLQLEQQEKVRELKKEETTILDTKNKEIDQMEVIQNSEPNIIPEPIPESSSTAPERKRIDYSTELFYEWGQKGMNQSEIARQLGISANSISLQLKKPDYFKAYQNGLANSSTTKKQNEKPKPVELPTIESVKTSNAQKVDWSEQLLEDLAARHFAAKPAAKELGVHYTLINQKLDKSQTFADAWFRGQEKYCQNNPDFIPPSITRYARRKKLEGLKQSKNQIEVPQPAADQLTLPKIDRSDFMSRVEHVEMEINELNFGCMLKCRKCYMNRSFSYAQYNDPEQAIKTALAEYEDDHRHCGEPEVKAIEPIVVNNRIGEIRERINQPVQINSLNFTQPEEYFTPLEVVKENRHSKSLDLGNGASLNLSLENLNLFETDPETRTWINHFINQIQGFEKRKNGQDSACPET